MDSTQTPCTSFIVDILCMWLLYHVDSDTLCSNTFIPWILRALHYFGFYSVALHDLGAALHRDAMDHQRRFKYHHGDVDYYRWSFSQQNNATLITKNNICCEYILYYFSSSYLFLLKEVHNALILLTRIINFNQILVEQNLLHFFIPKICYLLLYLFLILAIE